MQQKEFYLHECYAMACQGKRAIINNGKLEGFIQEDTQDGVQEHVSEGMPDMRETV